MNLVVANENKRGEIKQMIDSFDQEGETFWQKRNTVKVFELKGQKMVIKSFKIPHLINRFAYRYIRKSKARRSYEHATVLLEKGMRTPKPIAYQEDVDIVGLKKSFYVSENLDYDFDFNALYDIDFSDRKNILEQFAEFTYDLHEKGIHHFDHSRGNTLIIDKKDRTYDFYLIDLNRMVFEDMNYQKRVDNFNRLGLTPEMIKIISKKYAELIDVDEEKVFKDISHSCEQFDTNRAKKKKLKSKFGLGSSIS